MTDIEPLEAEDWPETFLWTDDIDFDGKPDFFVLEEAAVGSGTSKFRLIDWDRKNSEGKPLFIPFDTKNFPPFNEEYEYQLFFQNGVVYQPGFHPDKKILNFSGWNGPFYDLERWCFNDSQYFLCEKVKISYYAGADNMYEIARFVRFNKQGDIISITCHTLEDFWGASELLFIAGESIPLYLESGDKKSQSGVLEKGDVVTVKDFRFVNDEHPAIWYKIQKRDSNNPQAWCCVAIKEDASMKNIIGIRKTKDGAEALVEFNKKRMILSNRPLYMYNFVPFE